MMWLRRIDGSDLILTAMAVVAGSSVIGAFGGWWLVVLAGLGAAVAFASVPPAARLELVTPEWLALSLVLFMALGGLAAGPVPTPGAYQDFFGGLINGWADLLSSVPPVALDARFRVVPYALAWLAATTGFGLVRHIRQPGLAALGPLACFGLGLLFTLEDRAVALAQGGLLAALALALGLVQQRHMGYENDESLGNTTMSRKRARLLGAVGVLAVVAVISPAMTTLIPGLDGRERFNLRDKLDPPWEPLNEPSPLAQIKGNYGDEVRDDVVFVADGSVVPDRWALATLSHFDGTVWTVGDSDRGGAAAFIPIDRHAPIDLNPPLEPLEAVTVAIEVVDLDGPWLPIPGWLNSIAPHRTSVSWPAGPTVSETGDGEREDSEGSFGVTGLDGAELASGDLARAPVGDVDMGSLRFNQRTGTVARPEGAAGLSYVVEVRPWPVLSQTELEAASLVPLRTDGLEGQAGVVRSRSADLIEGAEQGWPQVAAIRSQLRDHGFYLADDRVRPGHSWARLGEFLSDEQWYGNEEQYAAVAAIVARDAGLSARVVVGYDIDDARSHTGRVEIYRHEASAWIEVLTAEHGWVPVDVTPDRDKEPSLTDPGVRIESVAAPNPPPPPPPPSQIEAETPAEDEPDDQDDEEQPAEQSSLSLAMVGAGTLVMPVGLAMLWMALIAGLKAALRRRRRRGVPSSRVAGAWFEAADRLEESGRPVDPRLSVWEQARHIGSTLTPDVDLASLATVVDRAAFDSTEPAPEDADRAWSAVTGLRDALRHEASWFRRLIRLGNPIPLLRKGAP